VKAIIVFDSECPLCVRFKQSLLFLDKGDKFEFRSLQDETTFLEYPILDKNECEKEINIIINKSEVLKGPDAVEFIIKSYPKAKAFSWLIESESGKKTMDFFYNKVNQLRKNYKKSCSKCGNK